MVRFYLRGDEPLALYNWSYKGAETTSCSSESTCTSSCSYFKRSHSFFKNCFIMLPATFKLCAGISYRHMRNMTGKTLFQDSTLYIQCSIKAGALIICIVSYIFSFHTQVWGRMQWLQSTTSWTSFLVRVQVLGSSISEEGAPCSVRQLSHFNHNRLYCIYSTKASST